MNVQRACPQKVITFDTSMGLRTRRFRPTSVRAALLVALASSACFHYAESLEVKGGTYPVGCSEPDCAGNPSRAVQIGSFMIDSTLVTAFEYGDCVDEGACPPLAMRMSTDSREVAIVSARGAEAFCNAHGGRLPTSDEWEIAARGPGANVYPWGKDWRPEKLTGMRSVRRTRCISLAYDAAGTRPDVRSAFGLEDTIGPGTEWVSAGADRFAHRGCAGFSRRSEQANNCKLARVQETSLNSVSAFRCAYAP